MIVYIIITLNMTIVNHDFKKIKKEIKKVKIRIPKTRDNADDVYVAVNGKSYLIKRGVYVEVPASVAEVIEHSEEMQAVSMEYEDARRISDK